MRLNKTIFLSTLLAVSANAGTLLEVGVGGANIFASAPIGFAAAYASGFSLDQAYTNLSVEAVIGSTATYPAGKAFLMRNIGSSASVADELRNTVINFPFLATLQSGSFQTIFSGLTLDAGAYFLVIETPVGNSTDPVGIALGNAIHTVPGVALTGDFARVPPAAYAPSSNFANYTASHFRIRVSGDPAVPEPATMALVGAALLIISMHRRRS